MASSDRRERCLVAAARTSSTDITPRADSTAAINPAKAIRRTLATTVRKMFTLRLSRPLCQGKTDQNVALHVKHFFLLRRFGVVKAEKVQHAVSEEH